MPFSSASMPLATILSSSTTKICAAVMGLSPLFVPQFFKRNPEGGPRPVAVIDGRTQLVGQGADQLQAQRRRVVEVHRPREADTVVGDRQGVLVLPRRLQVDPDVSPLARGEGVFQGVGNQFVDD